MNITELKKRALALIEVLEALEKDPNTKWQWKCICDRVFVDSYGGDITGQLHQLEYRLKPKPITPTK